MNKFDNLNVVIYVTGSIACYKTLRVIRLLKKRHVNVRVVMSLGAQQFINPVTFKAISGSPVLCQQNCEIVSRRIPHVDLARWTDIAIVMPATANVIAKMANGISDGLVSTCLLATAAPKLVVPAMNNLMWINPATQQNVKTLTREKKVTFLGPVSGKLTEGISGKGRMLEPEQVVSYLNSRIAASKPLFGMPILVTAGGTHESIDPVRFITNGSTGKMGYAIAEEAQEMGAKVTLISGHADVPVPNNVKLIRIKTTEEMQQAVLREFPNCKALIMSAALADFEPVKPAKQKIKKSHQSNETLTLRLKRTPDVLQSISKIKQPDQLTIGFAAETQNLVRNASQKLRAKKLDVIAANDVSNPSIGFGSDNNQVTFLEANGKRLTTGVEPKKVIAKDLLKIVAKLKDDRS